MSVGVCPLRGKPETLCLECSKCSFLSDVCVCVCVCVCVYAQSCVTLCSPMDWSLPGFSAHGISQARILECNAISWLQGILPTRRSDPHLLNLLHLQADSLPLCHLGSPSDICTFYKILGRHRKVSVQFSSVAQS